MCVCLQNNSLIVVELDLGFLVRRARAAQRRLEVPFVLSEVGGDAFAVRRLTLVVGVRLHRRVVRAERFGLRRDTTRGSQC